MVNKNFQQLIWQILKNFPGAPNLDDDVEVSCMSQEDDEM